MDKQAFFIRRLESDIKSCQQNIEKFAEKLIKDPAHTFTWSNETFRIAAQLKVSKQVYEALTSEDACTIQDVKNTLMDRVLHRSKYPAQSTSPCSNLMEQYELSVYADILSYLNAYE